MSHDFESSSSSSSISTAVELMLNNADELLAKACINEKGQETLIKALANDQREGIVNDCSPKAALTSILNQTFLATPEGRKLGRDLIRKLGIDIVWKNVKKMIECGTAIRRYCFYFGQTLIDLWMIFQKELQWFYRKFNAKELTADFVTRFLNLAKYHFACNQQKESSRVAVVALCNHISSFVESSDNAAEAKFRITALRKAALDAIPMKEPELAVIQEEEEEVAEEEHQQQQSQQHQQSSEAMETDNGILNGDDNMEYPRREENDEQEEHHQRLSLMMLRSGSFGTQQFDQTLLSSQIPETQSQDLLKNNSTEKVSSDVVSDTQRRIDAIYEAFNNAEDSIDTDFSISASECDTTTVPTRKRKIVDYSDDEEEIQQQSQPKHPKIFDSDDDDVSRDASSLPSFTKPSNSLAMDFDDDIFTTEDTSNHDDDMEGYNRSEMDEESDEEEEEDDSSNCETEGDESVENDATESTQSIESTSSNRASNSTPAIQLLQYVVKPSSLRTTSSKSFNCDRAFKAQKWTYNVVIAGDVLPADYLIDALRTELTLKQSQMQHIIVEGVNVCEKLSLTVDLLQYLNNPAYCGEVVAAHVFPRDFFVNHILRDVYGNVSQKTNRGTLSHTASKLFYDILYYYGGVIIDPDMLESWMWVARDAVKLREENEYIKKQENINTAKRRHIPQFAIHGVGHVEGEEEILQYAKSIIDGFVNFGKKIFLNFGIPVVVPIAWRCNLTLNDEVLRATSLDMTKILLVNLLKKSIQNIHFFTKLNPRFNGTVSLLAHSLGTVITFDALNDYYDDFKFKAEIGSPLGRLLASDADNITNNTNVEKAFKKRKKKIIVEAAQERSPTDPGVELSYFA